ncbi:MAG: 23S rRNA (pseudouridine(1915)-N(3))-methyltransferase RlmH [Geobacteraceae bacterium]|nr:23S rRNA (pseudouridine(1915)-N(3))-methyltransferase RlmH [Geobacteraceae bacterium]
MKITVICIGKLSLDFLRAGAEEYSVRIKRYATLKVIELKEEKGGASTHIRERESTRLLERIPTGAYCVVLDEKGKHQGSVEFATALERRMLHGESEWCFVIGGAYGVNENVRGRADSVLSLSHMTWTHQMARMLLLEQLYRAFTIMRSEPYHNR